MQQYFEQAKSLVAPFISAAIEKFNQFSLWQQVLISTGALVGSSIAYVFTSYHVSKFLYNQTPRIDYTIHGNINDPNCKGVIFFLHGWPDSVSMWDLQVKYFLEKGYVCIPLQLPNFDISKPIQNPWGFPINVLIDTLGQTMFDILQENGINTNENSNNNSNASNIYIISHDWGSFFAQNIYIRNKNRIKFNRIVLMDVGDGGSDDPKQKAKNDYQLKNAILFLFPRFFGNVIYRFWWNRRLASGLREDFPLFRQEIKDNRRYFDTIHCYPYFYVIKNLLLQQASELERFGYVRFGRIDEIGDIPILFINAMKPWSVAEERGVETYYSDEWKRYITSKQYNRWEDFDCYHWIPCEKVGLPDKVNATVEEFFNQNTVSG